MKLSELTKPELEKIKENANFTDEELRIFKLLSQDKSITDIAVRMSASNRTINRKISKIKQKISKLEVLMIKVTQNGVDVDIENITIPDAYKR